MNIGILGSRKFKSLYLVKCLFDLKYIKQTDTIISGGALGVDLYAEKLAKFRNIKTNIQLPDWSIGKSAGYKRNIIIVNLANILFIFWDGKSKGTFHSINLAINENKPFYIINELGYVTTV